MQVIHMHPVALEHRACLAPERFCCDGRCGDGGTCPQFPPIHEPLILVETPQQRRRFRMGMTLAVALVGAGVRLALGGHP